MCEDSKFDLENIKILLYQYSDEEIQSAYEKVKQNFMQIYKQNLYLKFDIETIRRILSADDLNVENEEIVFETIVKWLNSKDLNPKRNLHMLLDVVRLHYLPLKCLWKLMNEYIYTDIKCLPMFLDAIQYHIFPDQRSNMLLENVGRRHSFKRFLAIGSWNLATSGIIELYDTLSNEWTHLKTIDINKRGYGGVIVKDTLMLIGGFNEKEESLKTVNIINLITGNITYGSNLNIERGNVNALVIDDLNPSVYVIGGYSNRIGTLNSGERWDFKTKEWKMIAPMSVPRDGCGCTLLCGKIYVAGGRHNSNFYRSMEMYDIENDSWKMMAPMINIRTYCRIVATEKYIYAIGGYSGDYSTSTVMSFEGYDPVTDKWTFLNTIMTLGLGGFCAYKNNGYKILKVGGKNNSNITEEYDEETGKWKMLPHLIFGRDATTVLEIPSSINQFDIKW